MFLRAQVHMRATNLRVRHPQLLRRKSIDISPRVKNLFCHYGGSTRMFILLALQKMTFGLVSRGAFGDDKGDVVVLLVGAEGLDLIDDGGEKCLGWEFGVSLESSDEAVFAELFF
jgi:hypothetical protein